MRNQLWSNLKKIYDKFPVQGGEMSIETVEEFIRTAMGEGSQQEVDYVMKNIFRLDADKSGFVSFRELANFLFTRHCAEMSLQIMHRGGKLKNQSERKMTLDELQTLCTNAWKFLGISCPNDAAQDIFREADKDKDGLITYVEYFQFIEKFICQTKSQFEGTVEVAKPVQKAPEQLGPERFSRLRKWIWD